MELEILEERENPLLKRKELKINIKHPNLPTPKKQELVKELALRYSVPENYVLVNYIFTKKGMQESFAKAKIYQEPIKLPQKSNQEKQEAKKNETQAS